MTPMNKHNLLNFFCFFAVDVVVVVFASHAVVAVYHSSSVGVLCIRSYVVVVCSGQKKRNTSQRHERKHGKRNGKYHFKNAHFSCSSRVFLSARSGEIWTLISFAHGSMQQVSSCARHNHHPTPAEREREKETHEFQMEARSSDDDDPRKKPKKQISRDSRDSRDNQHPTDLIIYLFFAVCSHSRFSFSLFSFLFFPIYLQMVFVRQQWPPHLWLKYSNYTKYYNLKCFSLARAACRFVSPTNERANFRFCWCARARCHTPHGTDAEAMRL